MKRIISITVTIAIIITALTGFTHAASATAAKFSDVKETDWFAEAVGKLNILKIIDGLPDGSFNPQGEVTRAQFVKMLVQAMEYKKVDSVSFKDLKPFPSSKAHWASVYIETALRNGVIVKEEIGENFFPDVPLTREDMGMMMFRALKLEPSNGENPFADMAEGNPCLTKLYEEYLIRGIIEGGKVLYKPQGISTRAEAAAIIARMVEYKDDPEGFKARMAMEERFKNGTQTEEDIALKRQIEIEKAKADPNYIMEPQISIINTFEQFKVYGEDAEWCFNHFAGFIALDNYEDYKKYSPDCQLKIVATDKDKDLLNTITELTQPFISYDHRKETRVDTWKKFSLTSPDDEFNTYIIRTITRDEEKSVKGKWVKVPDYVKKGETINFKLYLKRGNNTKEYSIKFKVN